MRSAIARTVVGQDAVIDQVLMALFAGGHVLIEGVPGLGKTLLVRTLSGIFGGAFGRIQFTPDLMPADITGHVLYDMKAEQFRVRKGPVFCNLLLADEINRTPPKTQGA
ncbi:MAG: AAA family ATPase, partial [Gammaproteobacteria bacterium]